MPWLECELRRREALLAGDGLALAELIDPDCVYVHAGGMVETGASYVRRIGEDGSPYLSLTATEVCSTVFVTTAVMVYRQVARMRIDAAEHDSVTLCTATWQWAADSAAEQPARLIGFHNAMLPPR